MFERNLVSVSKLFFFSGNFLMFFYLWSQFHAFGLGAPDCRKLTFPTKFGAGSSCKNGGITFLIRHMTSCDLSCKRLLGARSKFQVTTLPILMFIGVVEGEV